MENASHIPAEEAWHYPHRLLFDPANQLTAQLAQAVYNYYNLTGQ